MYCYMYKCSIVCYNNLVQRMQLVLTPKSCYLCVLHLYPSAELQANNTARCCLLLQKFIPVKFNLKEVKEQDVSNLCMCKCLWV